MKNSKLEEMQRRLVIISEHVGWLKANKLIVTIDHHQDSSRFSLLTATSVPTKFISKVNLSQKRNTEN